MPTTSPRASVFQKIRHKFRYGLVLLVLRDYLRKLKIDITPYYWMKETIPAEPPALRDEILKDCEFSLFGREDIEAISRLPERQYIGAAYVLNNFDKGKKCVGVKYKGEIAGCSWFSFEGGYAQFNSDALRDNEAYLFDVYVLKAFRGKNLAPMLRYKSYAILKEMGRDTCYSVTECFNTPSRKVKQKLGAQYVFLGLQVSLFGKFKRRWILRRY